ncbi:MAG: hypothetical protein N4A46_06695 [Schleiferiaceae bacterium]|jgi:hypothetical protein|nr:hypothetical protein [Schleiferiaceae bacterium]
MNDLFNLEATDSNTSQDGSDQDGKVKIPDLQSSLQKGVPKGSTAGYADGEPKGTPAG